MGRVKELLMDQQDTYGDWYNYELPETYSPTPCSRGDHSFPNTGLLKSWCKECGIEAEFNRETGKYVCTGNLPQHNKENT